MFPEVDRSELEQRRARHLQCFRRSAFSALRRAIADEIRRIKDRLEALTTRDRDNVRERNKRHGQERHQEPANATRLIGPETLGAVMPKNLKRYYGRGDLHFVTFSCYRRLPLLRTIRARNLFVRALGSDSRTVQVLAAGLCGHARARASVDQRTAEIDALAMLKALKQRVSRDLRRKKRKGVNGQFCLPFMGDGLGVPRFWQPRFYDFNVYSSYKVREKLEYMHGNPVKRGLVKNPGAWMWSSFVLRKRAGWADHD